MLKATGGRQVGKAFGAGNSCAPKAVFSRILTIGAHHWPAAWGILLLPKAYGSSKLWARNGDGTLWTRTTCDVSWSPSTECQSSPNLNTRQKNLHFKGTCMARESLRLESKGLRSQPPRQSTTEAYKSTPTRPELCLRVEIEVTVLTPQASHVPTKSPRASIPAEDTMCDRRQPLRIPFLFQMDVSVGLPCYPSPTVQWAGVELDLRGHSTCSS